MLHRASGMVVGDSLERHREWKMDVRCGKWNVERFTENSSK
jgi:hypothetical protein